MNDEAAPVTAAAEEGPPVGKRPHIGSLTRRMIVVAALWITILLLTGGFALDRILTTSIVRTRTDYGFSPRMFVSALVQYSSADRVFSSNFRYRWEYLPGSELFVVYTDERDTLQPGYPDLKNRAFVVKVNRLFRF